MAAWHRDLDAASIMTVYHPLLAYALGVISYARYTPRTHPAITGSPLYSKRVAPLSHEIHGILESPSIVIALQHNLQEGLIDHIRFLLAFAIGKRHFFGTDYSRHILHIIRNTPVKRDVGEHRLTAPSAWHIHSENKILDRLLNLLIGQVVLLDVWSQVGVET